LQRTVARSPLGSSRITENGKFKNEKKEVLLPRPEVSKFSPRQWDGGGSKFKKRKRTKLRHAQNKPHAGK
jgi:hypothetical protein